MLEVREPDITLNTMTLYFFSDGGGNFSEGLRDLAE
jgi:hypothetical protein